MLVTVKWLDDTQTILCYDLFKNWTWDEMFSAFATGQEMIGSVNHKM